MSTIGEKIAKMRTQRGMTQSDLGNAIGESKQTIYKYEHGIITNIPLPKIEAIAKALHCPPVALTGWNPDNQASQTEETDPHEIRMIARAGKKMSPEKRAEMLRVLKAIFPEEFEE